MHTLGAASQCDVAARVDEKSSLQFLVLSSQTLHRGAGQGFEFMAGEVFLAELDVVDAAASSFYNGRK